MGKASKFDRVVAYGLMKILTPIKLRWATNIYLNYLEKWGVDFKGGRPSYIAGTVKIDGTDFSAISIGNGATMAGYCRLLTHDWTPGTLAKGMGVIPTQPIGRVQRVDIGEFTAIGTGVVVMPGTNIGRCCLVGAGTVVRGDIPDYSIVTGSPCSIVGDTRHYMLKNYPEHRDVMEADLKVRGDFPDDAPPPRKT